MNLFERLGYDTVIAYDYDVSEEGTSPDIIDRYGSLAVNINRQQQLTSKQARTLTNLLTYPKNARNAANQCFRPNMGIVFYKKKKVVAHLSISIECNKLHAYILPPENATQEEYDAFTSGGEFGKKALGELYVLFLELNFSHCKGRP